MNKELVILIEEATKAVVKLTDEGFKTTADELCQAMTDYSLVVDQEWKGERKAVILLYGLVRSLVFMNLLTTAEKVQIQEVLTRVDELLGIVPLVKS